MLGFNPEDLQDDPEMAAALIASREVYEEQQKAQRSSANDKLLADITTFCEMLGLDKAIIDNLKTNFQQYCRECYNTLPNLKSIDFSALTTTLFSLSSSDYDKVVAHIKADLHDSATFVNQFNYFINLNMNAQSAFSDMIARPLPKQPIKEEKKVEKDEKKAAQSKPKKKKAIEIEEDEEIAEVDEEEDEDAQLAKAIKLSQEQAEKDAKKGEKKEAKKEVKKQVKKEKEEKPKAKKPKVEEVAEEDDVEVEVEVDAKVTSAAPQASPSSNSASESDDPIKVTRLLRFSLQIPAEEMHDCMQALESQQHWDNAMSALKAYEQSLKGTDKKASAEDLIGFLTVGPKSKAITHALKNTTQKAKAQPSKDKEEMAKAKPAKAPPSKDKEDREEEEAKAKPAVKRRQPARNPKK